MGAYSGAGDRLVPAAPETQQPEMVAADGRHNTSLRRRPVTGETPGAKDRGLKKAIPFFKEFQKFHRCWAFDVLIFLLF